MAQTAITISIQRCHLVVFCPSQAIAPEIPKLSELFESLNLPVEFCEESNIDSARLESLVQKIGPPRTEKLRKVLLICGQFLEKQVSFAAHYLLLKGYAVHLLRDLIVTEFPDHALIHDQRLLHAGAVSTTTRQLMYEWIGTETDEIVRRKLNKTSLV
jgi:hypothetical protein